VKIKADKAEAAAAAALKIKVDKAAASAAVAAALKINADEAAAAKTAAVKIQTNEAAAAKRMGASGAVTMASVDQPSDALPDEAAATAKNSPPTQDFWTRRQSLIPPQTAVLPSPLVASSKVVRDESDDAARAAAVETPAAVEGGQENSSGAFRYRGAGFVGGGEALSFDPKPDSKPSEADGGQQQSKLSVSTHQTLFAALCSLPDDDDNSDNNGSSSQTPTLSFVCPFS